MKSVRWRRVGTAYLMGAIFCGSLLLTAKTQLAGSSRELSGAFQPHLVVADTRHDFGDVVAGTVLRREFSLKNQGTSRVVIHATGGCCGNASAEPLIAAPGEEVKLPLSVSTAGHTGSLKRRFTVSTSDPARPQIVFELVATVIAEG